VLLVLAVWAGTALFLTATVVRVIGYARLPRHLRWELYPIPHERADRAARGGSYFEDTDWWTRPRFRGRLGALRFMLSEMLLLKALREHNLGLWRRSYPFHLGLYLLSLTLGLVLVSTALDLVTAGASNPLSQVLYPVYRATGLLGLLLTPVGALLLLQRRLTDPALRGYSAPADLFNLVFFVAALGLLAAGRLSSGPEGPGVTAILRAALTFDTALQIPPLFLAGIVSSSLLLAYIPLTHMAHFVGKWFTWHGVRWEDEPLVPGSRLERRLMEQLSLRPTWAARHIGADGRRDWSELAGGETPPEDPA
jgi:nitrate reductase gamma subunit